MFSEVKSTDIDARSLRKRDCDAKNSIFGGTCFLSVFWIAFFVNFGPKIESNASGNLARERQNLMGPRTRSRNGAILMMLSQICHVICIVLYVMCLAACFVFPGTLVFSAVFCSLLFCSVLLLGVVLGS